MFHLARSRIILANTRFGTAHMCSSIQLHYPDITTSKTIFSNPIEYAHIDDFNVTLLKLLKEQNVDQATKLLQSQTYVKPSALSYHALIVTHLKHKQLDRALVYIQCLLTEV